MSACMLSKTIVSQIASAVSLLQKFLFKNFDVHNFEKLESKRKLDTMTFLSAF